MTRLSVQAHAFRGKEALSSDGASSPDKVQPSLPRRFECGAGQRFSHAEEPPPFEKRPQMVINGEDVEIVGGLPEHLEGHEVNIAEYRTEMMARAIPLAISSTNENDWSFIGNNLWLDGTGAEKVARRFGVTFGRPTIRREWDEDAKGRFYNFICEGEGWLSERDRIWVEGTASSRDDFLTRNGKVDADSNDIRKKAFTNWEVNIVTRLLGLRGITGEDLRAANLKPELIARAEFKSSQESGEGGAMVGGKTPIEMRLAISQKLIEEFPDDEGAREAKLKITTAFTTKDGKSIAGIPDIAMLSGKRLEIAYGKICGGRK